MKNYVVWTNCEIRETTAQFGIESAGSPEVRASYDTMFQASRTSARAMLRGNWQEIVWQQPAESRTDMFQQNWRRMSDLWHSEPCNILYLDSDTVMLKPVEIFGRWPDYRLFNWSTPPTHAEFPNYFNAAVRYHPAHMSQKVWDTGEQLAQNWRQDIWDQEQVIFNQMFWSQPMTWEDAHHPELNWQAEDGMNLPELKQYANFNTLPIEHARILHYHGTRSHRRGAFLANMLLMAAGIR